MSAWNYIVLGVSLSLLVWMLWMEVRRVNRRRRMLRVVAVVLSVCSLACLALPLTYRRDPAADEKEGVLLTEGYDPDSLREFVRNNPKKLILEWKDGAVDGNMAGLSALHVFGYGLTGEEWAVLHVPRLVLHPPAGPTGVIAVDWKRKLAPGEPLRVQGRWQSVVGQDPRRTKIFLTGMGAVLDSTGVDATGEFVLSTIPSQVGRSLYRLVAVMGADTVERDDIPVEVLPGKTLKILLLAASPDFENTFLMNWLSKGGHAVARRTMVSRGQYDRAFVNMAEETLSPLSPYLLDRFDIVMADQSVLSSFGAGELSALRRAVQEKGMGLILALDSVGKAGIGSRVKTVIGVVEGLRAILRDSLSRITAGVGLYGAGKILYTTLRSTYSQILSGGGKQYAIYWSEILREVAREAEPEEEWRMEPPLPRVGEPVRVWLQAGEGGVPQGFMGRAERAVYLAQDMLLPFYWQGMYWPEEAGWQPVRSLSGEPSWWYVWPAGEWVGLHRWERRRATREEAEEIGRAEAGLAPKTGGAGGPAEGWVGRQRSDGLAGLERVPVPKGWFYAVFLLCVVFLWAERKMEWMNGRIVR